MGSFNMLLLLLFFITISSSNFSSATTFRCNSTTTNCSALVGYVSPNTTTISAIGTLFDIENLRTILGANNLPPSTPGNYSIPANRTVKIPFPCICINGTGISNHRPNYTVVPNDGLFHIAADVFSGLVTYQEIQAVNNISDANLIEVGQSLWIPLPCSCDDVDGEKVVHYGHVVAPGSSVAEIAQQYNTSQDTLLRLNNLSDPQQLKAGAVLDVPLRACSSSVSNNSHDYPLLVSNGTYVFTANNCVTCNCDAALSWTLQCQPTGNSQCGLIRCGGAENLSLGNTTSSGCNRTTCAYAGFNNQRILTTLASESTCPAPGSSASRLEGWRWNEIVIFIHVLMLCIRFIK